MEEELIKGSINEIKELPAVKRLYKNGFIKRKVELFNKYLKKLVPKSQNEKKVGLSPLNWILINCIVFAYIAGLAKAQNVDHLTVIYENYQFLGIFTLVVNLIGLFFSGLKRIFLIVINLIIQVVAIGVAIVFIGFLVFIACYYLAKFFRWIASWL